MCLERNSKQQMGVVRSIFQSPTLINIKKIIIENEKLIYLSTSMVLYSNGDIDYYGFTIFLL